MHNVSSPYSVRSQRVRTAENMILQGYANES